MKPPDHSPQVMVNINRDKAQALGVTTDQIENAPYDAYGNRQITRPSTLLRTSIWWS
jgi:multidrug efflux pump subunit AcrB